MNNNYFGFGGNLKRKATIASSETENGDNESIKLNQETKMNSGISKKIKIERQVDGDNNVEFYYLMPIQIVTCGLQGCDLGRDETAILQINFQILDLKTLQKIALPSLGCQQPQQNQKILLQAASLLDQNADASKIHISVPARELTGLLSSTTSPSQLRLEHALNHIEHCIRFCDESAVNHKTSVIPVTVGDLPLRAVLHREARFRGLKLANYWNYYYDLLDQISSFIPDGGIKPNTLFDICKMLNVENVSLKTSDDIVLCMTQILVYLLQSGHCMQNINEIWNRYTPAIFRVDDPIDDDVVVMIKPIDYKTPVSQIIPFFNGINISPGGVAVLMADGRRSNRILVRMVNRQQRNIALMRDKHHFEMGNTRFITITAYDSKEFMKIAGYSYESVRKYLVQIVSNDQILIRMKGLPFTVTKADILEFFKTNGNGLTVQFDCNGIYLVQKVNGELNGDAFVLFESENEANRGIALKGGTIGNRYVEIFQSTPAEMNQVVAIVLGNSDINLPNGGGNTWIKQGNKNGTDKLPASLISMTIGSSGIITSLVPKDATDSDFFRYLGNCSNYCFRSIRLMYDGSFITYLSELHNAKDVETVLAKLANRPFFVQKTKTTHIVLNSPLITPQSSASSVISDSAAANGIITTPCPTANNFLKPPSAITATNFPMVQPSSGLTNNFIGGISNVMTPSITNSSSTLIPVRAPVIQPIPQPNYYIQNHVSNQHQNLILPLSSTNTISQQQQQQYQPQIPNDILYSAFGLPASALSQYQSFPTLSDFNVSNHIFKGANMTKSNTKKNLLYLYGTNQSFNQNDLDIIFHSIKLYISCLPRLLQKDQFMYAAFSSSQDANIALQKCPIICHRNLIIRLMSIDNI